MVQHSPNMCVQMLASIFRQLGGQGHVPGFMAGEGGNASGMLIQLLVIMSAGSLLTKLYTVHSED